MRATNECEKDFLKLLNNAVYGKTMENVEKRKKVKIVASWESNEKVLGARAHIAKPNFHSSVIFTENMVAIQLKNMHFRYTNPMYLGFVVLELSKWKMYDFHYQYMKPKFEDNLNLCYMDTDSFIYEIQNRDFYSEISPDVRERFDTLGYSLNNPFKIEVLNKKVLGMFKDENNGLMMKEFIGLRPKMYSYSLHESIEVKKAKGVPKRVLNSLKLSDYGNCLHNRVVSYGDVLLFRSRMHTIYTEQQRKIALSGADDKRFIEVDEVNTLAWGHYRIQN